LEDAAAKTQDAAAEVRIQKSGFRIIKDLQSAVGGENAKLDFLHWRLGKEGNRIRGMSGRVSLWPQPCLMDPSMWDVETISHRSYEPSLRKLHLHRQAALGQGTAL
jgi:hypothetical protein